MNLLLIRVQIWSDLGVRDGDLAELNLGGRLHLGGRLEPPAEVADPPAEVWRRPPRRERDALCIGARVHAQAPKQREAQREACGDNAEQPACDRVEKNTVRKGGGSSGG
eukprot:2670454-Pleurochrysis_carterae.AAC.3